MNKLVDEAPFHPGYEDAVVNPTPKYTGLDPAKMIWKHKSLEDWYPDVRFEDGVYRFELPNGDEFVIVPKDLDENRK